MKDGNIKKGDENERHVKNMTHSNNSRRGRKKATPSRQMCSCNDPDCDVKVNKGKYRKKERIYKKMI